MFTVRFKMAKETQGAYLYTEVDDQDRPLTIYGSKIGNIYVRKDALKGAKPDMLQVAVTEASPR